MDSGYSGILVGCNGNKAKLTLEPHLKAAAILAALAEPCLSLPLGGVIEAYEHGE